MKPNEGEIEGQSRPSAEAPLGGVLDFLKLLWALDHGLQTASRAMEAHLGVTGPQRMVVRIVGRYPGISPGDLAIVLHLHPSTLTGILHRLEQRRILRRDRDRNDGRRARFFLTSQGERLDAVTSGTVEALVRDALAHIPPGRVEETQRVLRELVLSLAPRPRGTSPRSSRRPQLAGRKSPGTVDGA